MNKYIVTNCPCYWHIGGDAGCDLDSTKACQDCTDCLIKQVIDKCKEDKGCPCPKVGSSCYECPTGAEWDFSNILLQLFEIEECE